MNYKLYNDSALDDLLEEVIADIAQDEHNSTAEPVTVTTANLKAIILNSTMRSSILANIALETFLSLTTLCKMLALEAVSIEKCICLLVEANRWCFASVFFENALLLCCA